MLQAVSDQGASEGGAGRIDGRRLRSRRTRERLIAAYLDLAAASVGPPTCNAVAQRAGCSVRTLFDRFRDMAELARSASDRAAIVDDGSLPGMPVVLDRAARIRLHVTTRARQCERWLPEAPAAAGDDLSGLVELETFYEPELSALAAADRRRVLIALGTLTDIAGWQRIRQRFGASVAETCEIWHAAIDRLLPSAPSA